MEFKAFIPKGVLKEIKDKKYDDSYDNDLTKFSPLKLLSTESKNITESNQLSSYQARESSREERNDIHETSPVLEKQERSTNELGPFIRSRESQISKLFPEEDLNYYTFEGNEEEEYDHPKQLSSKERLKLENENLSFLRKSTSPAKTECKGDSHRYSKANNSYCENSYTEQKGARNNNKVDLIRLEINELMEKMENASKSFFESCDFANKNIDEGNIKIEEFSRVESKSGIQSNKEIIANYSKAESDQNKENSSIQSNSINCDFYILRNKYEMAMETIRQKENEIQGSNFKIAELQQDLETISKQHEIQQLEWKLEKQKLENKINLLESSLDVDKVLPCYLAEIEELQKKVLHLYKTCLSKCDEFQSETDPLIKEEKQIRALKKQLQNSLKLNEKLEKEVFSFK